MLKEVTECTDHNYVESGATMFVCLCSPVARQPPSYLCMERNDSVLLSTGYVLGPGVSVRAAKILDRLLRSISEQVSLLVVLDT